MIRVLLVDDQPLVRAGLRRILEPQSNLTIVGECEDGDEVIEAVGRTRPTVVLMDVRMTRTHGATATLAIGALPDPPPVLILTTFGDEDTVAAALRAGAAGFLLKDARGEEIVRATITVAEGGAWLDPQIVGEVIDVFRRTEAPQDDDRAVRTTLATLTPREVDVLRSVGRGSSNGEVAAELHISEATVKSHLGRLLTKLDLRDRAAAIVLAHRLGLV